MSDVPAYMIAAAKLLNAQLLDMQATKVFPKFLRDPKPQNFMNQPLLPDIFETLEFLFTRDNNPSPDALEAYGRLLFEKDGKAREDREIKKAYDAARAKHPEKIVKSFKAMPLVLRRALRDTVYDTEALSEALNLWVLMLRIARIPDLSGGLYAPISRTAVHMQKHCHDVTHRSNTARSASALKDYKRRLQQMVDSKETSGLNSLTEAVIQQKQITIDYDRQVPMSRKIEETAKATPDTYNAVRVRVSQKRLGEDFSNVIGLDDVKNEFRTLRASIIHETLLKAMGMETGEETDSYHLAFLGPPGTAKTTFARITGQIYKQLKILESGHVIEVKRGDLVANYIGQTATKTRAVIEKAYGGVLFIDEAYQLYSPSYNDFGREAIAELIVAMENERHRLVVIMAGYSDDMAQMLDMNPGLTSRLRKVIAFNAYSDDELVSIFEQKARENGLIIKPDVLQAARAKILEVKGATPASRFGNGRYIRNLVRGLKDQMATRLMKEGVFEKVTPEALQGGAERLRAIFEGEAAAKLITPTVEDIKLAKAQEGGIAGLLQEDAAPRIGFNAKLRA